MTPDDLLRAADLLSERIATVHERRDCPTCLMPRGVKCIRMRHGLSVEPATELKHPHNSRIGSDGINLR